MGKRILLLANEYTTIINFRIELLKRLVTDKYEVFVAIPGNENNRQIEDIGCAVLELPLSRQGTNPIEDLKCLFCIKRILKIVRPDIVFTFTVKPNVYGGLICSFFRIPYVANITGLGIGISNNGITSKIVLLLYKIGLKSANKIFFQNMSNLEFMLKRHIIKKNYELIPGSGVNLNRFKLLAFPDNNVINFLYIARVMKEKGIEQYIDAARAIKKKHANTIFHVCGMCEQGYEDRMKKLADENVIVYHGQVKEIEKMHIVSQCTIHPSFYPEGMSNVLLESAASGRPVITTNQQGCKEIVDDGITGFLVRPKDSNDLIAKIESFLNLSWEERRQMGLNGRKKVEREFDREIVIQKYMNEVNNIS